MSFNVEIKLNSSDKQTVSKKLTAIGTVTGVLRDKTPFNISNPVIDLQTPDINFNYLYIPEFKRYYYVTDKDYGINGIVTAHCHVDVLMSFKNEFLKLNAIIQSQENDWNLYLNDGTFKIYQNPRVQCKKFPNEGFFNDPSIVLLIAGGN